MTKNMLRRQLRQQAFQALLAMEFGSGLEQALRFACWHDKEEQEGSEEAVIFEAPSFMRDLVQGVSQHQGELDTLLTSKLKSGWTLERLTFVEKNLLRLGLFEIQFYPETPAKVAVNEAVELAKTFSDQQAARFVNGILTQFVAD